jgi:hypothetical protein
MGQMQAIENRSHQCKRPHLHHHQTEPIHQYSIEQMDGEIGKMKYKRLETEKAPDDIEWNE